MPTEVGPVGSALPGGSPPAGMRAADPDRLWSLHSSSDVTSVTATYREGPHDRSNNIDRCSAGAVAWLRQLPSDIGIGVVGTGGLRQRNVSRGGAPPKRASWWIDWSRSCRRISGRGAV